MKPIGMKLVAIKLFTKTILAAGVAASHFWFATTGALDLVQIGLSFLLLLYAREIHLEQSAAEEIPAQQSQFWQYSLLLGFIIAYAVNFVYLSSSVFTGDGITQQALDHFTINSLVEGSNGWLNYHYGLLLIAFLFVVGWNSQRMFIFSHNKPELNSFLRDSMPNKTDSLSNNSKQSLSIISGLLALAIHPASADLARHYLETENNSGIDTQLVKQLESGFISEQQINEHIATKTDSNGELTPSKNILVIYLESFEKANLDAELFPSLAPKLRDIVSRGMNYGEFRQAYGASHTIAGLVSSQCGIPYATPGGAGNIQSHGRGDFFMPHVQCLGDITKKLGYRNIYMQGGTLNFTRKGTFFSAHGYDEVSGDDELWPDAPKDKKNAWGLYDFVLFDFVFKRVQKLFDDKSDKPFMLTMLTLDTHDPFNPKKMNDMCTELGIQEYAGRRDHPIQFQIHCSDTLLSQFINKLQTSFGKDLDIYLITDHLAHAHSIGKTLKSHSNRDLIFTKLSGRSSVKMDRKLSHLDIGATLLDEISGGKFTSLGMGVSAKSNNKTLLEKWGLDELNHRIKGSTTALARRYWRYPSLIENPIRVRPDRKLMWLGDSSFSIPLAFNLNDKNQIISYFSKPVDRHLRDSNMSERIIYIETCGILSEFQNNAFPEEDYCLLAGNLGSEQLYVDYVGDEKLVRFADLEYFLNQASDPSLHKKRLYERSTYRSSNIKSTASKAIHPIGSVRILAAEQPLDMAVTNYWNRSLFDKFEGWQNYKAASRHALYFYQIKDGTVQRLHAWTQCNDSNQPSIRELIDDSEAKEFFMMTGKSGAPCTTKNNQFKDSPFHEIVSELQKSEPYIGYYNREINKYIHTVGKVGESIELRLIDDSIYNNTH